MKVTRLSSEEDSGVTGQELNLVITTILVMTTALSCLQIFII